jgi:hypothetical protein
MGNPRWSGMWMPLHTDKGPSADSFSAFESAVSRSSTMRWSSAVKLWSSSGVHLSNEVWRNCWLALRHDWRLPFAWG